MSPFITANAGPSRYRALAAHEHSAPGNRKMELDAPAVRLSAVEAQLAQAGGETRVPSLVELA